ncbi:long-chain fatty acid--CoA ligase [Rhizobium ruizarguesonis]|uniref:class I adenylate-forming enzyme family protein n=1 Tax=Rhizobium ruizarguesonis TaxID=2081791 RepID=UPI0010301EB4|nr:class I adenylate-forming enzyme family protein [Rhizobium ruizarguesonis]TAW39049.1 long-chain fatty acid--CoA ligase [Rhizobium ruizarguesonis]
MDLRRLQLISRTHPIPSLAAALSRRSLADAIVDCASGVALTYEQLADAVDLLAGRLMASGFTPDCATVLCCRASLASTICMLAAWQAGMVPVPLAELPTVAERERIFAQCQTGVILCDDILAAEVAPTAFDELTVIDGILHIAILQYGKPSPANPTVRDKLALIVYTSGTTGHAKGVMLGAGAMVFATSSMAKVVEAHPGERALVPLSSSHLYGIVAYCYLLSTGGTIYSVDPYASGEHLIHDILDHRLDAVLLQPQHVKRVLDAAAGSACSTVRYVACGSGGVSMAEARRLAQFFPAARQFFYYALSEAPRAVYMADAHRSSATEIPLGRPAAGMRLKLDGVTSAKGNRIGEIVIGGPAVAIGYIGDAAMTDEKFDDDNFYTGDLGEDIDGEIFYRGRTSDVIEWNGVRISPWATELRLAEELGRCTAIIGLGPGATAGERSLRAVIEGSLSPAEQNIADAIIAPLAIHLGLPLQIETVPSLPRNATGKVLRRQALSREGD